MKSWWKVSKEVQCLVMLQTVSIRLHINVSSLQIFFRDIAFNFKSKSQIDYVPKTPERCERIFNFWFKTLKELDLKETNDLKIDECESAKLGPLRENSETIKILWVLFSRISPWLLTVFLTVYLLQSFIYCFVKECSNFCAFIPKT